MEKELFKRNWYLSFTVKIVKDDMLLCLLQLPGFTKLAGYNLANVAHEK